MNTQLLNRCRIKLTCLLLGHDWGYFLDGSVCRICTRCRLPQYDLPAPKPVKANLGRWQR